MADKAQFDRTVKSTRSGLSSLAASARRTLGGIAVAYAGAFSIDKADQQQQAEKKLSATLKATGYAAGFSANELKKFAAERQGLTNFGDEATINLQALLTTFKQIKGPVFKETTLLAQDMASVMGTDLSAAAIQLGKAVNDPTVGLTALTRVGVTFSQQQKDQIRDLQKSGDLMGAQKMILSELRSEFGGAAEAMASPWQQLQNELGDTAETVGAVLMPAVQLFNWAARNLNVVVNDVRAGLRNMFGGAGDDTKDTTKAVKTLRGEYEKLADTLKNVDGLTHLIAKNELLQREGQRLKKSGARGPGEFERLREILGSDLGGERLDLFSKLGKELEELAHPAGSANDQMQKLFETMQILQTNQGIPGVSDSLDDLKKIIADKSGITKALADAKAEFDELSGMDEDKKLFLELAQSGAPGDKLLELKDQLEANKDLEKKNELRDYSEGIKDDLDPLREFDRKTAKLEEAFNGDLINSDEFAKSLEKARGDFEKNVGVKPEYLDGGRAGAGASEGVNAGTESFNQLIATALTGRETEQKKQTKNLEAVNASNEIIARSTERVEQLLAKNRVITKPDGP
jgi:hypothetical protein